MKKIHTFLSSKKLMGILLLVIALAMAIATFVETKNSTAAARALVYNAKWFEALLVLLCINLLLNIYNHKLLSKRKFVIGLFHLSFVFILIGSALTRYIGFEGIMHIREGENTDYIISAEKYVTVSFDDEIYRTQVLFSEITSKVYSEEFTIDREKVFIKSVRFIKNAVVFDLKYKGEIQQVTVFETDDYRNMSQNINLDGKDIKIAYGVIKKTLPFSVYLNDFQLEKYPGSNSPSSYKSLVTINQNGVQQNAEIFMNNTLSFGGYKFFQSSYDIDEKGTILSVNHDFWGTSITYLGYALMILGMILALMGKNTHFRNLINRLKQNSATAVAVVALLLLPSAIQAQAKEAPTIDSELVEQFESLWVQGADGRIEPVSTLASEIIRKIAKRSHFMGKKPAEMVLSMGAYPNYWSKIPLIKVSNKTLAKQLNAQDKYLAISTFFANNGEYKIADRVRKAYAKSPALRNRVEKELIYVDERVNIAYMVFSGSILHVFPRKDNSKPWYAPGNVAAEFTDGDSIFINSGYLFLTDAIKKGNKKDTKLLLDAVGNFQTKYGGKILPSQQKLKAEMLYNKFNPFKTIFPFYLILGFVVLLVLFINIFRNKSLPKAFQISALTIAFIIFLMHTAGLVLRWYISGHAPWSNGYESLIYVAWAVMLSGFIFGRKYTMVIGIASFLTGISLFVAHLSWMNPEITNLVPVLKSYWLTIHVAIITASYGFIGLSAFIGILVMILILIKKHNNIQKVEQNISKLTIINEMSVIVGLYFLTIGTFLGAIWANESWGRYWGWDPKETWSLITIFVYSFVTHMRLIPRLKSTFAFNFATIISFSSVIMTYFGVNYYLTGLHSYGKGISSGFSYGLLIAIALILLLIIGAFLKNQRYNKKKNITF